MRIAIRDGKTYEADASIDTNSPHLYAVFTARVCSAAEMMNIGRFMMLTKLDTVVDNQIVQQLKIDSFACLRCTKSQPAKAHESP